MNSDQVAILPLQPPQMSETGDMGDKVAILPPHSGAQVATVAIEQASRTIVRRALVLPRGDDDRGLTSPRPPVPPHPSRGTRESKPQKRYPTPKNPSEMAECPADPEWRVCSGQIYFFCFVFVVGATAQAVQVLAPPLIRVSYRRTHVGATGRDAADQVKMGHYVLRHDRCNCFPNHTEPAA